MFITVLLGGLVAYTYREKLPIFGPRYQIEERGDGRCRVASKKGFCKPWKYHDYNGYGNEYKSNADWIKDLDSANKLVESLKLRHKESLIVKRHNLK